MKSASLVGGSLVICCVLAGCVSVKAPERITIGSEPPPADVDSSRVPHTETHEQAQAELFKAYQQIRYLEHQFTECRNDLMDARDKYKRLKDKYDD